jgi:SAM-dependent methyltransferase
VSAGRGSLGSRVVRSARRLVAPVRPVLYRNRPFSTWGLERGTPIDRWYIAAFLERHRADIRGRVLEVKDSSYTDRFGTGVTRADVLDIDELNPRATAVADLSAAGTLPSGAFDCFVLTQTLQYVSDPVSAVAHVHRVLAPGGVVLASLPSIIRVESPVRVVDRWRFTEASCRDLFAPAFGADRIEISTGGNVAAAVGFLLGMAAEELGRPRLDRLDPDFPVVALVRAVKAGS